MPSGEFQHLSESASESAGILPTEEIAAATANLGRKLQYEKESRREERFILSVFIVALIDAFLFMQMNTWSGPIVLGLVELVAFAVFARRSGVDEVVQLLDKLLVPFCRDKSRNKT